MRTRREECQCRLCDGRAQAVPLIGLAARRIECEKCTSYEISEGLEGILADNPEAKELYGLCLPLDVYGGVHVTIEGLPHKSLDRVAEARCVLEISGNAARSLGSPAARGNASRWRWFLR